MPKIDQLQVSRPAQVQALKEAGLISAAQAKKLLAALEPPKTAAGNTPAARATARRALEPSQKQPKLSTEPASTSAAQAAPADGGASKDAGAKKATSPRRATAAGKGREIDPDHDPVAWRAFTAQLELRLRAIYEKNPLSSPDQRAYDEALGRVSQLNGRLARAQQEHHANVKNDYDGWTREAAGVTFPRFVRGQEASGLAVSHYEGAIDAEKRDLYKNRPVMSEDAQEAYVAVLADVLRFVPDRCLDRMMGEDFLIGGFAPRERPELLYVLRRYNKREKSADLRIERPRVLSYDDSFKTKQESRALNLIDYEMNPLWRDGDQARVASAIKERLAGTHGEQARKAMRAALVDYLGWDSSRVFDRIKQRFVGDKQSESQIRMAFTGFTNLLLYGADFDWHADPQGHEMMRAWGTGIYNNIIRLGDKVFSDREDFRTILKDYVYHYQGSKTVDEVFPLKVTTTGS